MSLIVQKFGGTSVASADKLRRVARRVAKTKKAGHDVVVVVSAMGSTTEELLDLARDVTSDPCHRELDILLSSGERVSKALLALALQQEGLDAISLSGPQAGIRTCDNHFNASIVEIRPDRVLEELGEGRVVVVAGYQGMAPNGDVTTLGRGGSDTSAVALAAALEARRCEIFSDVEAVFSADPRVVEDAFPIAELSYDEMLELARQGASVLKPRAVLHAKQEGVWIRARSTFSEAEGTLVGPERSADGPIVAGVAGHDDLVRLSFRSEDPGFRSEVLDQLGLPDVFLGGPGTDLDDVLLSAETVPDPDSLQETLDRSFPGRLKVANGLGSASIVGLGVGENPELRRSFETLAEELAPASGRAIARTHSLTCVPEGARVPEAMNRLHRDLVGRAKPRKIFKVAS